MNAKKLKEINQKTAYRVLEELYKKNLWDPVVTNRMSELHKFFHDRHFFP